MQTSIIFKMCWQPAKSILRLQDVALRFEYSLVAGVNDNEDEARQLAALLNGFPCHVNLIPVNPIKERNYVQSGQVQIEKFKKLLEKSAIHVTIRREMGRDIDGACGQLRKSYLEQHT